MSTSCQEAAVVTGLGPAGRAIVKVRRAEACHSCEAKGACTALGGQTQDMTLVVDNAIGARPGDQVILSLSEASVIKASAVLYLIPAAGLVGGAVAGWALAGKFGAGTDPASIVGSLVGLGLGLGLTKIIGAKMSKGTRYIPRLTAIINPLK